MVRHIVPTHSSTLLLIALVPVIACSGSRQVGSSGSSPSSRDVLGAEELSTVAELTLLEAVERLRPMWLTRRGVGETRDRPILVYYNNIRVGGIEYLEQIPMEVVAEVRYHDPGEVRMRWGVPLTAGAIEVIRKTPGQDAT